MCVESRRSNFLSRRRRALGGEGGTNCGVRIDAGGGSDGGEGQCSGTPAGGIGAARAVAPGGGSPGGVGGVIAAAGAPAPGGGVGAVAAAMEAPSAASPQRLADGSGGGSPGLPQPRSSPS